MSRKWKTIIFCLLSIATHSLSYLQHFTQFSLLFSDGVCDLTLLSQCLLTAIFNSNVRLLSVMFTYLGCGHAVSYNAFIYCQQHADKTLKWSQFKNAKLADRVGGGKKSSFSVSSLSSCLVQYL